MSKNITICIFCRFFHPHIGGNETQALLLAKELINSGVNVNVVTGRTFNSYPKYEQYEGVHIYRVGELHHKLDNLLKFAQKMLSIKSKFKKPTPIAPQYQAKEVNQTDRVKSKLSGIYNKLTFKYFAYFAAFKLNKLKDSYDIIHSQMLGDIGPIALKVALKTNKPILIKDATLGGLSLIKLHSNIEETKKQMCENAKFIAVSSQIAKNLESQGIEYRNIFRIPNGIDITNINNKHNTEAIKNTILYVGNFWQGEIKGLDVLIRAVADMVKIRKDFIVNIAGQGNVSQYKTLAENLKCQDQLKFLGQVKNMDSLYRSNSIFILPSRQEGMSNATLEAMSYGMPCVVTNVSGSEDQIKNGVSGIITPIEDHKTMADALLFMMDNPDKATQMGEIAKQIVIEKFDIKVITKQYIELYDNIIN